jgi:excisionase family DNA binding protein
MKVYTLKEAAELLRISSSTLYAMVQSGEIEHARVRTGPGKRGTIRFSEDMVRRYLEDKTVQGAARTPPTRTKKKQLRHLSLD